MGLLTDILGTYYFRDGQFQGAAEAALPLTALINANNRVPNWRGRAHLGNAPIRPILLDACEDMENAGMPLPDDIREAITEHGMGVTIPGAQFPAPSPGPRP